MALLQLKKINFSRPNSGFVIIYLAVLIALACFVCKVKGQDVKATGNGTIANVITSNSSSKSVKKELKEPPEVIVISEKSLAELDAKKKTEAADSAYGGEEYKQQVFPPNDAEMPDSFKTGFYVFLGLSCGAIIFIVYKVYSIIFCRLRLSRAERRYGVQGDRTTQELTPLPVSIEDDNSDEDDHTLFEVNRQNIRIL